MACRLSLESGLLPTAYLAVGAGISDDIAENKYSYGDLLMMCPKNALLKNKELLGEESRKKWGPQKIMNKAGMYMKTNAGKKSRVESPVMFMKNKQVTRFSGDVYEN